MENKYEITKELRETVVGFFTDYGKCLEQLKDEGKSEFTEEEVNEILNLLGSFRLRDVFHIVERFKIEVSRLKSEVNVTTDNTTEQAG